MVKESPKRIEWIDTAKGLGLMLVFIGHLHPPYLSTWIYTCHMPLFFFLSGLVFSTHPFREFIKKRFLRLIIPYFCLGIVIYLFWAGIYAFENRPARDYWDMLSNFLEQRAFWTVWFLAALFVADVILWFELFLTKGNKYLAILPSCLIMICTFFYYRTVGSTLVWCIDVGAVAQFFILLGYIFKSHWERVSQLNLYYLIPLLFFINIITGYACIKLSGSGLDMSVGLYGNEVLSIISAISGIFAIIFTCMQISNRFLRYLGRNTMIFFAWHSRIIIIGCGLLYGALGLFQSNGLINSILYTIVTLILILAILYPITERVKKSQMRKYFGV